MEETVTFDGLAVEYSDDKGAPAPAPAQAATQDVQPEAAAAAPAAAVQETESADSGSAAQPQSAPKTYKYGDRELSADELYEETTKNLLPAFTRATQELSTIKGSKGNSITKTEEPAQAATPKPWEDPNWVPEKYGDIVKVATEVAKEELKREQQQEAEAIASAQTEVDNAIAEIKKTDPGLNEDALFKHLNDFGFTDLKLGYANYKMVQEAKKTTAIETANRVRTRQAEPIAGKSGVVAADDGAYDPSNVGRFESAADALRAIKQG